MPLLYARKDKDRFLLGLWRTTEPEAWFRQRVRIHPGERPEEATLHPSRRLDWLSTRHLLHLLSGAPERLPCLKDTFGKPYLEGEDARISISHTGGWAAIILSPFAAGVDVQRWDERLERLATRFARPEELEEAAGPQRLAILHVLWGAKEALYKAHGRRRLDFRAHLLCGPVNYRERGGAFEALIREPGRPDWPFVVQYRPGPGHMLVWALEKLP